ncbi:MAG: hypothetical protein CL922_07735 [Deltaproteobacteria bacterium]|nr:hypothetical protein [Deltaproteobacteria bacterium]
MLRPIEMSLLSACCLRVRCQTQNTLSTPTISTSLGALTNAQVEEIAQTKMPDLNCYDLEAAKQTVAGTARSMGVEVAD